MRKAIVFCLVVLFSGSALGFTLDGVPFKSQSPPGDWNQNMNCGPASVLMVGAYYQHFQPGSEDLEAVLDWLYEAGYISPQPGAEYYDGNLTNANILENLLTGFFNLDPVIKKNSNDWNYLGEKLQQGNPIIVGVNVDLNPQKMGHFMVVVGQNLDQIIVHDPGRTQGEYRAYPRDQFEASWATSGYVSLVVDISPVTWHPDGSLVQVAGENQVYLLDQGRRHWIFDEQVFNALHYDWQKIISISQAELDCYDDGGQIDWQPYHELFRVGETYYLLEKSSVDSVNGAIYEFASTAAFNSWNIPGYIQDLASDQAETQYFSHFDYGGLLYLRHGTLVKPGFDLPGYGPGVVFVCDADGYLLSFESWDLFTQMGYDQLPIILLGEQEFYASYLGISEMIDQTKASQCLNGSFSAQGGSQEIILADNDDDGYDYQEDCNDNNPQINPGQSEICDGLDNNCNDLIDEGLLNACGDCGPEPEEVCDGLDNDCDGLIDEGLLNACGDCGPEPEEVCDGLDNDCDGLIDEGDLCLGDQICLNGYCQNQTQEPEPDDPPEDPPEEEPEPIQDDPPPEDPPEENQDPGQDDPPPEEQTIDPPEEEPEIIECTVTCPGDMQAFIWYASFGEETGASTVTMSATKQEICLRGQPWIDFNCAGQNPLWSYYDPGLAQIDCNVDYELKIPGIIDSGGEGEVWFTSISCWQ